MKAFQFTRSRSRSEPRPKQAQPELLNTDEPPIQAVQGIMPDSVQEWRFALALMRMNIPFRFQFPVDGGRSVRGGQVIDFWIYTSPLPTPVYIQGQYWHRRTKEAGDLYKVEKLKRRYRGQIMEPVLVDAEAELSSVDAAMECVRRRILYR